MTDLKTQMAELGYDNNDTRKAYMIINRLACPALMGALPSDVPHADQVLAAQFVLWHWPQASDEPMPSDTRVICSDLVNTA